MSELGVAVEPPPALPDLQSPRALKLALLVNAVMCAAWIVIPPPVPETPPYYGPDHVFLRLNFPSQACMAEPDLHVVFDLKPLPSLERDVSAHYDLNQNAAFVLLPEEEWKNETWGDVVAAWDAYLGTFSPGTALVFEDGQPGIRWSGGDVARDYLPPGVAEWFW